MSLHECAKLFREEDCDKSNIVDSLVAEIFKRYCFSSPMFKLRRPLRNQKLNTLLEKELAITYDHFRSGYFGMMRQKIQVLEDSEETRDKKVTELKNRVKNLEEKVAKQKSRIKRKNKELSKRRKNEEEIKFNAITKYTHSDEFTHDLESMIKDEAERTLQILKDRGTLEPQFHDFKVFHCLLKKIVCGEENEEDQDEKNVKEN